MTHIEMIRELQAVRREIATLEEVLALRVIQKRDLYATLFVEHRAQMTSDTKADAVVKQDARYADFERETAGIARYVPVVSSARQPLTAPQTGITIVPHV